MKNFIKWLLVIVFIVIVPFGMPYVCFKFITWCDIDTGGLQSPTDCRVPACRTTNCTPPVAAQVEYQHSQQKNDVVIFLGIDKGNWLSYLGGVLVFYGTLFLGMVAFLQNKRLLEIEKGRNSCNVILDKKYPWQNPIELSNENEKKNGPYEPRRKIKLNITNHGEAILNSIRIIFPHNNNEFFSHIVLAKGESKNVKIKIPQDAIVPAPTKDLDDSKRTKIIFTSCNGLETWGNFVIFSEKGHPKHPKIKYYHFYGLK